jgi:acyl dehydratase
MRPGIKVGMSASLSRTLTAEDIELFARATGDSNPLHMDSAFAEKSRFGARIAHGLWTGGLVSAVLGTQLPGPGTIYLAQTLRFRRPVFIGDTITASVRIVSYDESKRMARLESQCVNQGGQTVLEGEAEVLVEEITQ